MELYDLMKNIRNISKEEEIQKQYQKQNTYYKI